MNAKSVPVAGNDSGSATFNMFLSGRRNYDREKIDFFQSSKPVRRFLHHGKALIRIVLAAEPKVRGVQFLDKLVDSEFSSFLL